MEDLVFTLTNGKQISLFSEDICSIEEIADNICRIETIYSEFEVIGKFKDVRQYRNAVNRNNEERDKLYKFN